jgi:hypothetical protein
MKPRTATHAARSRITTTILAATVLLTISVAISPAGATASYPGQGFLPDNRAWEMVTPPDKHGVDVPLEPSATRAAADGSAITFALSAGIGDVVGTGVTGDYLAERARNLNPGNSGWTTHAISPQQTPMPAVVVWDAFTPQYEGEFSADLNVGVYVAWSPLTEDSFTRLVPNLYRRADLRTPGAGSYESLTACPFCEQVNTPVPPRNGEIQAYRPHYLAASPDLSVVLFESLQRLTTDTPPQPSGCTVEEGGGLPCRSHLYESVDGSVLLAGVLPDGAAADMSVTGSLVGPHLVSDGSDGHRRVFFTQPTDAAGHTVSELTTAAQQKLLKETLVGKIFMRIDGATTEQVNLSERTDCGIASPGESPKVPPACTGATAPVAVAPATYLAASVDGTRVFFESSQALTDDAPVNGEGKLYMYDASKPGSDPHNLTLISRDEEPTDGGSTSGMPFLGASADGRYVYFTSEGKLVKGQVGKAGGGRYFIYLWHDGTLTDVGVSSARTSEMEDNVAIGAERQTRVTPDGRHLLFPMLVPGTCDKNVCRQLNLYSADTNTVTCVSCDPNGGPTTAAASVLPEGHAADQVATPLGWHESHPLSDDGHYVFFTTAQSPVPEDTNGVEDAYEYNAQSGEVHLLSSGESAKPSFFVEATHDGSDAFFGTREQLSGWDVDGAYDLYDARVGGGFPEPPPPPPSCQGDACQPPALQLNDSTPASVSFSAVNYPSASKTTARGNPKKAKRKVRKGRHKAKRSSRRAVSHGRRALR